MVTTFLCNLTNKKRLTFRRKYGILYTEIRKGVLIMYYWFTFEDGYSVCVRGFSKQEMRVEIRKHGKLVSKERA